MTQPLWLVKYLQGQFMTPPPLKIPCPEDFIALPQDHPHFPSCLLCSTLRSFLPLFLQLHRPQLVSPSPLLPGLHTSIASSFFPASASTVYHTPHLTIQGILLSSNPCCLLPSLVILLPYRLCCTLLRILSINPLHFAGFLSSPKCPLPL